MGKAVYVLDDMPDGCYACRLSESASDDSAVKCMASLHRKTIDNVLCRPDWCPLKELPDGVVSTSNEITYDEGFFDGWNSFRRRILGEED